MSNIVKVFPSIEECQIKNIVPCTEEDCSRVFRSESNLTIHLAQTHKIKNLQPQKCLTEKQFFCPVIECRSLNKKKFFKGLRDLREHFLKMHAEKNISCSKCKTGFPSLTIMKRHLEFCGIKFSCPTCSVSYNSYETLKTHCRRKKHMCLEKKKYLHPTKALKNNVKVVGEEVPKPPSMFHPILPNCGPYVMVLTPSQLNAITKCSQDSQTNRIEKAELVTRTTQVNNKFVIVMKNSQETQTESKSLKSTVSTQTENDSSLLEVPKKTLIESDPAMTQKNVDIQTDKVEIVENSCNTSFKIEDLEFTTPEIEKSSSATQTMKKNEKTDDFYSTSTMTHDTIHTDTSDLLTDMSNFDSNFFNCNMETQTQTEDFMLNENELLFDSDFYSNMYTQTCDEILSGVSSFNDIQTQTVVDDILRSVESQTLMTQFGKIEGNCSNMETQTDSEFREMLEIINS